MNSLVAARPTSVFSVTGFIRSKLQQKFGILMHQEKVHEIMHTIFGEPKGSTQSLRK